MSERHVSPIDLPGHRVGPDETPFVIAEVSGNHNGSLERALEIIDAIAASGAQAVKFQTYTADTLTIDAPGPQFRIRAGHDLWGGRTLHDLYDEAHTPWEWHAPMFERAREHGLLPFSSPFDPTAIELLESLDCPVYKIASAELVDLPLIREVASTGKPMIISSGMATLGEIDAALEAARARGLHPDGPARLHRVLPRRPRRRAPAVDPHAARGVRHPDRALRPHGGHRRVRRRRRAGRRGPREARDPAPRRRRGRLRLLARARRARGAGARDRRRPARRGRPRGSARPRPSATPWPCAARSTSSPTCGPATRSPRENVRSIRPAGGLPTESSPRSSAAPSPRDVERGTPLTWDLI